MRFVVYNPRSAGGRTGRRWPAIARRLKASIGELEATPTAGRADATRLVREAIAAGARDIIAVGGDGTISEAADGILSRPHPAPVTFGFVSSGTGGDFCRSLGLEGGIDAACERLASGRTRTIDAGRIRFFDDAGVETQRHFVNIASFGLSGRVTRAVNEAGLSRLLGARGLFHYHSVATLLRHRFQNVAFSIDGAAIDTGPIATIVVANGSCFGGGMKIAPRADLQDGALDVVVVRGTGKRDLIQSLRLVYTGGHLDHPAVSVHRGRRIEAVPRDPSAGPVLLEIDGEAPGRLPACFEVLPAALTLRC